MERVLQVETVCELMYKEIVRLQDSFGLHLVFPLSNVTFFNSNCLEWLHSSPIYGAIISCLGYGSCGYREIRCSNFQQLKPNPNFTKEVEQLVLEFYPPCSGPDA